MSEPWIIEIGMDADGLYWGRATPKEEYEEHKHSPADIYWYICHGAGYRISDYASKRMLIRQIKRFIRRKEKEWVFDKQVIEWQP